MDDDLRVDSEAQTRARTLRTDPRIARWIKRLRAVAESTPADVWVCVASGTVCVMAKGPGGPYMGGMNSADGVDQAAVIASIDPSSSWDGGDW